MYFFHKSVSNGNFFLSLIKARTFGISESSLRPEANGEIVVVAPEGLEEHHAAYTAAISGI